MQSRKDDSNWTSNTHYPKEIGVRIITIKATAEDIVIQCLHIDLYYTVLIDLYKHAS